MRTWRWGDGAADTVLLHLTDEEALPSGEKTAETVAALSGGARFLWVSAAAGDWNDAFSPWPAPPVFGDEPFGGRAEETLSRLLSEIVTELSAGGEKRVLLGGYSLAGLFALWASTRTDRFAGVAAVSPSVWFPGFSAYLAPRPPRAQAVYLSLGDREERTRNPATARVGDAIREAYAGLRARGVRCTLEWNPGGHFKDPELRTAKGFAWLLSALERGQTAQFPEENG